MKHIPTARLRKLLSLTQRSRGSAAGAAARPRRCAPHLCVERPLSRSRYFRLGSDV